LVYGSDRIMRGEWVRGVDDPICADVEGLAGEVVFDSHPGEFTGGREVISQWLPAVAPCLMALRIKAIWNRCVG
jgi:hypothetical protein